MIKETLILMLEIGITILRKVRNNICEILTTTRF